MKQEYRETEFRMEKVPDEWPRQLAIISAFATTGETWTDAENAEADERLNEELRSRGLSPLRITGYSPRTGHAEESWAVEIDLDDACEIGRRFRQDSIYFIIGDTLYVTSCEDPELEIVGTFRERVHET